MTIWQPLPFHVPRLRPNVGEAAGSTAVTVTVTMPAAVTMKAYDAAPLVVNEPENVSVTVGVVGMVGVVGVVGVLLSLHAARTATPAPAPTPLPSAAACGQSIDAFTLLYETVA